MPRIRTIKPEMWADQALGNAPIGARLLYIGLITQADDEGRFKAAPALVRGLVFPYDETLSTRRVEGWLRTLADANLIRLYAHKGEHYGDLPSWSRHQRIDRPSKSVLPAFEQRDRSPASPPLDPPTRGVNPAISRGFGEPSTPDQDQEVDQEGQALTSHHYAARTHREKEPDHQEQEQEHEPPGVVGAVFALLDELGASADRGTRKVLLGLARRGATEAHFQDARVAVQACRPDDRAAYAVRVVQNHMRAIA